MRSRESEQGRISIKLILVLLIVVPILLFVIYTYAALSWSYSEGERAGHLLKFSRKGWVCKTYEGELAMSTVPGVAPVMWNFTVRDDSVADQVTAAIGKKVAVHYTEHKGIPSSCFGETSYFVDSIVIQE